MSDNAAAPTPDAAASDAAVPAGEEAAHIREMELQEIADGAMGDSPFTRGAARDQVAALRAAAAPKVASEVPASVIEALRGITDDYQTSDHHHPNHVLIPTAKFEQLRAAAEAINAQ